MTLPVSDTNNPELFELAPVGYMAVRQDGRITKANLAARSLLRVTLPDVQRLPLTSFVRHEDQNSLLSHLENAKNSSQAVQCEIELRKNDGSTFWASITSTRIDNIDKSSSLLMVLSDISERREQEQSLRKSNERLTHAIDATRDGIWDWDIPTGNVYFSPQWTRLLGYEPDEVPHRLEFFYTLLHPEDVEGVTAALTEHLEGRTPVKQLEVRLRTRSGEYRWFHDRGEVVSRDSSGAPIRMVGTITDITERRKTADDFRESQARTRLFVKAASLGLWDWNLITNDVYFSPEWKQHLGYLDDELPNDVVEWESRLHPDDVEQTLAAVDDFCAGREAAYDIEFRLRHRDGSWRWIFARADVTRDATGRPVRMMGCHLDITDRKKAEQSSDHSLSLMRATSESTADGLLVVNLNGMVETFNQLFCEMLKVPRELLIDSDGTARRTHISEQLCDPKAFLARIDHLTSHPFEESFDTLDFKDGRIFERYSRPQIVDGTVVGRVWSFRDVTVARQAEVAQAEILNRLQKIASRIPGVVYQFRMHPDGTFCFPYASERMRDMFQIAPEDVRETLSLERHLNLVDPDAFITSLNASARNMTSWVHEFQVRHQNQSVSWLAGSALPERDADGATLWHGVIIDITDRKVAESKLRLSERRLREAQSISQIGNFHWDAKTDRVTWSDELFRLYGHKPNDFEPTFGSYLEVIHPDDRERVQQTLQAAIKPDSTFEHQYRVVLPDDGLRWVRARGVTTVDSGGSVSGLEGTCQDITEQRRIEEVTASLESQLRESQKMEAIGTLAGGIAHDFNNILAAIIGNVEISRLEIGDSNAVVQKCLNDVMKASSRARDLVQQILSFSRRQPTDRKLIPLSPVIREAVQLLQATLPASVSLTAECDDESLLVMADTTQISQVLINLVTNAMQAMNGHRGNVRITMDSRLLTKELTDAHPSLRTLQETSSSRAVRILVSDDGPGMDVGTLSRIFEPFYTTRPLNSGTGLGLAVVHGIIKGHDGVITAESELGRGAVFAIYLPAASHSSDIAYDDVVTAPAQQNALSSTSPHVLYLDDDHRVLTVVKQILERYGYQASCFADQQDALHALRRDPKAYDLVVTDYNMPEMNGLEVSQEVKRIRKDLPVVLTSGFIDETLQENAAASGIHELLSKPFSQHEIQTVIRRVIDQDQP